MLPFERMPSALPLVVFRSHLRSPACSGYTFCTQINFDKVAEAVGQYAFIASEQPLILSLEMHCSPRQQVREKHELTLLVSFLS